MGVVRIMYIAIPSLWSLATLFERSRAFSSDLDSIYGVSIYCVEPSKGSGLNKGHQDAVELVRDWRLMGGCMRTLVEPSGIH